MRLSEYKRTLHRFEAARKRMALAVTFKEQYRANRRARTLARRAKEIHARLTS